MADSKADEMPPSWIDNMRRRQISLKVILPLTPVKKSAPADGHTG